jgi:hypothetical protein
MTHEGHDVQHLLRVIPHVPGWFERHAVGFLRRRSPEAGPRPVEDPPDHPPYVLTEAERARVHAVVRATAIKSFLTGAVSAAFCVATWLALPSLGVTDFVERWLWLGVASLVATVFEIWRLYFDHLGAVAAILHVTGARLAATGEDDLDEEIAQALARAALDIPDPLRFCEEIDPLRETSRFALFVTVLIYRGKRGITNFLAKEAFLRLFPSGAMRAVAPLVAVPITGAWNALVSWRVLREARLRAVGPSAIQEVMTELLPGEGEAPVSEACRVSLLRAVGCAMVRKHTAHPNLFAFLWALAPHTGEVRAVALDDTRQFLAGLAALTPEERALVLKVFQFAACLDGHVGRKLRALIREARAACGLAPGTAAAEELDRRFVAGERIELSLIEALAR